MINEPTPQNNPNLDPLTRLQLEVISLKKGEEELIRISGLTGELQGKLEKETQERLTLEERIKTLETARISQIGINTAVAKKLEVPTIKVDKPKPIWRLW